MHQHRIGERNFMRSPWVPPDESESLYAKAGEPKKLIVLKGWGHYEVYAGEAFRQVIEPTLDWYGTYLPPR
jgi:fermentation-respiration switch protein FrsA (DUF1100 family)